MNSVKRIERDGYCLKYDDGYLFCKIEGGVDKTIVYLHPRDLIALQQILDVHRQVMALEVKIDEILHGTKQYRGGPDE